MPQISAAAPGSSTPAPVNAASGRSAADTAADPVSAVERVSALRERMNGMQRDRWEPNACPLPAGLATAFPHGRLRSGVTYTVQNSTSVIMAILAAGTADGGWAAVVGSPDFGVEAAVGFGIDLNRLVLVPSPGEHWLAVTAALVDVLPIVVVHPERRVAAAEVARLSARLRQTGCTLLVAGHWPQPEAALRIIGSRWEGLGVGHGYLTGRDLTVNVADRTGPGRSAPLRLPGLGMTGGEAPAALGAPAAPTVSTHRQPAAG